MPGADIRQQSFDGSVFLREHFVDRRFILCFQHRVLRAAIIGHNLPFFQEEQMRDGKTLAVRYKPGRILPALEVGLHVDAVHEEEVELSYNCSVAMGLLIAGAVAYLQERIPSGVDVDTARKYIRVDLGGVEQLKKFVTKMSLTDITFEKEAVNVELKLR